MIKIKDLGNFKSVPQIVSDLIDNNVVALDQHLDNGWDVNAYIPVGEYIKELPLDFALIMNAFESVKWLVEHNVELNHPQSPSFTRAVRYTNPKTINYLVEHGANINLVNNVRSDAFKEAIYGKKYDHLPLIHQLGHTVEKYGGNAFRKLVSDRNYKIMEFFLEHHVNVNHNEADMVYSSGSTPLCVAAQNGDTEMAKFLVEKGADATIMTKDGMRPYTIALEQNHTALAEYFKSIEPEELHNLQNKLYELKSYKLPKKLEDYLQGEDLYVELPDSDFLYIEYFTLTDTIPFKFGRKKLLRLSKMVGEYQFDIVWHPTTKKIAAFDAEHDELYDLATFKEFMGKPAFYLESLL